MVGANDPITPEVQGESSAGGGCHRLLEAQLSASLLPNCQLSRLGEAAPFGASPTSILGGVSPGVGGWQCRKADPPPNGAAACTTDFESSGKRFEIKRWAAEAKSPHTLLSKHVVGAGGGKLWLRQCWRWRAPRALRYGIYLVSSVAAGSGGVEIRRTSRLEGSGRIEAPAVPPTACLSHATNGHSNRTDWTMSSWYTAPAATLSGSR